MKKSVKVTLVVVGIVLAVLALVIFILISRFKKPYDLGVTYTPQDRIDAITALRGDEPALLTAAQASALLNPVVAEGEDVPVKDVQVLPNADGSFAMCLAVKREFLQENVFSQPQVQDYLGSFYSATQHLPEWVNIKLTAKGEVRDGQAVDWAVLDFSTMQMFVDNSYLTDPEIVPVFGQAIDTFLSTAQAETGLGLHSLRVQDDLFAADVTLPEGFE